MANLIQRIFIPPKKLNEFEKKNQIMQLVNSKPIAHHAYITKNGGVARRFSIKTRTCYLYAERVCYRTRPISDQIHYTLRVDKLSGVEYATHGAIDIFAEHVYNKLWKIWEKNKKNAKRIKKHKTKQKVK